MGGPPSILFLDRTITAHRIILFLLKVYRIASGTKGVCHAWYLSYFLIFLHAGWLGPNPGGGFCGERHAPQPILFLLKFYRVALGAMGACPACRLVWRICRHTRSESGRGVLRGRTARTPQPCIFLSCEPLNIQVPLTHEMGVRLPPVPRLCRAAGSNPGGGICRHGQPARHIPLYSAYIASPGAMGACLVWFPLLAMPGSPVRIRAGVFAGNTPANILHAFKIERLLAQWAHDLHAALSGGCAGVPGSNPGMGLAGSAPPQKYFLLFLLMPCCCLYAAVRCFCFCGLRGPPGTNAGQSAGKG